MFKQLKEILDQELKNLTPFLTVSLNENIGTSIVIRGSYDPPETWTNNIFQNSKAFIIILMPKFSENDPNIEVKLMSKHLSLKKLRSFTSKDHNKIAQKLKNWIVDNQRKEPE